MASEGQRFLIARYWQRRKPLLLRNMTEVEATLAEILGGEAWLKGLTKQAAHILISKVKEQETKQREGWAAQKKARDLMNKPLNENDLMDDDPRWSDEF